MTWSPDSPRGISLLCVPAQPAAAPVRPGGGSFFSLYPAGPPLSMHIGGRHPHARPGIQHAGKPHFSSAGQKRETPEAKIMLREPPEHRPERICEMKYFRLSAVAVTDNLPFAAAVPNQPPLVVAHHCIGLHRRGTADGGAKIRQEKHDAFSLCPLWNKALIACFD